jgi:hypothetical protein
MRAQCDAADTRVVTKLCPQPSETGRISGFEVHVLIKRERQLARTPEAGRDEVKQASVAPGAGRGRPGRIRDDGTRAQAMTDSSRLCC